MEERKDCWLGVFSPSHVSVKAIDPLPYPATAPWVETAALKFIDCSAASDFMTTGNGYYDFSLLDMREDVAIWLFYKGTDKPEAQARTPSIRFNNPESPRNAVIALTGDPTEMRVTWNSKFAIGAQTINYTVNGGSAQSIVAKSYTYTADDLCGYPGKTQGWREPGYFHTAIIKGLEPGKDVVEYVYGSVASGYSKPNKFKASQPVSPNAKVTILATADVGATEPDGCHYHWEEPDASLTYKHLTDLSPADVTLHIGDISYATGYSAKWDLFMHQATQTGSNTPLMTAQGNHEQDSPKHTGGTFYQSNDSGGECGVPTEARFPMPVMFNNQYGGWYSFDMGSAHIIMLSTELEIGPGSDQYDFLLNDLKRVNRTQTPWLIVGGHRPMYSMGSFGNAFDPHFGAIEPLLYQYKVDLALWGHVHNALVTCPVLNATCVTTKQSDGYQAPVHAVIGNGGMDLSGLPTERAPWDVYHANEYGYSTIEISNATHLEMRLFEDETNDLHYSFTLERAYPRS